MSALRFLGSIRARSQQDLEREMENVLEWSSFNVNRVAQLSNRQPLLMVGLAALDHFHLLRNLNVLPECAANFLKAVEHHYMCESFHVFMCMGRDVRVAILPVLQAKSISQQYTCG